jgi:N-terminal domain of galactosyltransferase/N-terminal region of glycosyl transferase group 7/WW domain
MSSSETQPHHTDLPLPPGWSREYSNSKKRYFYHHKETKHTQWHFPTVSEAKDPGKAKQRAEMNKQQESSKNHSKQQRSEDDSAHTTAATSASSSLDAHGSKRLRISGHNHSSSSPPPSARKKAASNSKSAASADDDDDDLFLELADATSVAIIVPFRDLHTAQKRSEHLQKFVPHMHTFFAKLIKARKVSDYHIYIVEQSNDGRKFNRGKLLNIGFDLACKQQQQNSSNSSSSSKTTTTTATTTAPVRRRPHDVFIFHDVDLLPADNLGPWYAKFPKRPIHIARVWNRYSNNPKYFGGVVSFSKTDYRKINGYPNTFWGWGGEDDEMHNRLERLGLTPFDAPDQGSLQDLEEMSLTEKLDFLRQNQNWKCAVKVCPSSES